MYCISCKCTVILTRTCMLQDVLQQFIVMKLPNILAICRTPESGKSQHLLLSALALIQHRSVTYSQHTTSTDRVLDTLLMIAN